MALTVVGPLGQAGEIVVSDEREDGTVILLVCRPPSQDGGSIAILPSDPKEVAREERRWPRLRTLQKKTSREGDRREPFRLVIEIRDLPPGPAFFATSRFLDMVETVAADGTKVVRLDPGNAEKWGYQPQ